MARPRPHCGVTELEIAAGAILRLDRRRLATDDRCDGPFASRFRRRAVAGRVRLRSRCTLDPERVAQIDAVDAEAGQKCAEPVTRNAIVDGCEYLFVDRLPLE